MDGAHDTLGCEWDLMDTHTKGISDGIGNGGGHAIDGYFGDGFDTEGAKGIVGFDQVRFHLRHIDGAVNTIIAEVGSEQRPLLIVDHFFADTVAKGLGGATLYLTFRHKRVDDTTSVNG